MKVDEYGFHTPIWPLACPPMHAQADILSVTVGNTHMTWTKHGTYENEFVPEVFWRTEALSSKDDDSLDDNDDDDVQRRPNRKSRTVSDFLAAIVSEKLFGSEDFTTASATQFRLSQKRIPYVYIYVISTNPEHASSLVSLFQGLPCILYRMSGNDFVQLPSLVVEEQTKPPPITIYDGIGVDRVANVIGAKSLFPKAKHLLVIDGGTALTYTTMVRVPYTARVQNDSSTNNNKAYRLQMGGGIAPGVQMRFRSLFEYTDDVPLVETAYVQALLNECVESKKPLPLFTSSSSVSASIPDDDKAQNIVSKSIIGCTITEVALILCSVIQTWLTIPHNNDVSNGNKAAGTSHEIAPTSDLLTMPVVILTGGDCDLFEKLLKPYHSYICHTTDANIQLLNSALIDDANLRTTTMTANGSFRDKKFLIRCEKRLQNYAVSHVLLSHCTGSAATVSTISNDDDIDVEILRNQLPGLRIARQTKKGKNSVLGTVVALKRGDQLDNDQCIVIYDGDNKMCSLSLEEAYASFQLFLDTPDKARQKDESVRIGMTCRRKDVEEAIAALRKFSPTIRKSLKSQQPIPKPKDVTELTVENFAETMASHKRKNMANAPKTNKRTADMNPERYENERIAKYFDIGSESGEANMSLFFGTVTKYVKEEKWWHIEYDDGDNEDMSVNELLTHLELYAANKSSDTNNPKN